MINPFKRLVRGLKEGFKENFTSVTYAPPKKEEVELTKEAKELQKYVMNFYVKKLESSITKEDVKNYERKISLTTKVPTEAWNKMALSGRSAYMDTLWFISFWNGDVDDLVI